MLPKAEEPLTGQDTSLLWLLFQLPAGSSQASGTPTLEDPIMEDLSSPDTRRTHNA